MFLVSQVHMRMVERGLAPVSTVSASTCKHAVRVDQGDLILRSIMMPINLASLCCKQRVPRAYNRAPKPEGILEFEIYLHCK